MRGEQLGKKSSAIHFCYDTLGQQAGLSFSTFFVDVSGHDWIQKSSDLLWMQWKPWLELGASRRTSQEKIDVLFYPLLACSTLFDKVVGNFPEEQRSHPFLNSSALLWRFSKWPQLQKFQYFLTLCCCHSIFSVRAILSQAQQLALLAARLRSARILNFIPPTFFPKGLELLGDLWNGVDFMFSFSNWKR